MDKAAFKKEFIRKISSLSGVSLESSSEIERYAALASIVRDELSERWVKTNQTYQRNETRQVYYFSLEFLLGQFLESHLIYLGLRNIAEESLNEMGVRLDEILNAEPDAGLGNGGLGRLAACFLDSLASMGLPGHGCGIRYKYGLFTQKLIDGYQVELPDNWLREVNAWEIRKPDRYVDVAFGGHICCAEDHRGRMRYWTEGASMIRAIPYDIPIPGYQNNTVNTLRLWSSESIGQQLDFHSFSSGNHMGAVSSRYAAEAISEVLYPDDSNYQNRVLRLKQQYFFVSAGLKSIMRHYLTDNNNAHRLHEFICIQINDTHPALAVAELMRILIDEVGFGWDEAWNVTTKTIAYTNHTIMPEALEKWPADTMREQLPRVYMIIEEINRRFCAELMSNYPGDHARWSRMAIVGDGLVRMAHLAIVGSFSVNGVAAVHSDLLKHEVLKDFYELYPEKFNNKTNGITHRRWLMKSNPKLMDFIKELLGDEVVHNPLLLRSLEKYKNDAAVLHRLESIKLFNKQRLANHIHKAGNISVDPSALFDVQVKRIHGYKRQLLNLLHTMHLLDRIRNGEDIGPPRVILLAGKAAPSYYFAKNVIKLANELGRIIASEPRCKGKLSLVFLENYRVSAAELIFPGSELSQQISTAGMEASGTGNMKFMMNGAVTIGTNDGANIEIRQMVGDENFISFGLSVDEVLRFKREGNYRPADILNADSRLRSVFEQLKDGLGPRLPHDEFLNITRSLIDYNDEFFVLQDFSAYAEAQTRVSALYGNRDCWNRMSLMNIAGSGVFSSDNTIAQYAEDIWRLRKETV